jgi:signal transduction histidine kinase
MKSITSLLSFCILLALLLIGVAACTKSAPIGEPQTELEASTSILVNSVDLAAQGLGGILAGKSLEQQTELCREFITPIRFFEDESGYFYIYDMQGKNIAHATQPDKHDQDLYDYQDSKGNLLIQSLIKTAQQGGGFVDFWWENPTTDSEEKKLGYTKVIPGTDFLIGSGIYVGGE